MVLDRIITPILKRAARPRFLIVYPIVALLLIGSRITAWSLRLGLPVAALGLAIRVWANGYVGHRKVNRTQPQRRDAPIGRLMTAGPYAFVRHPLYLGSLVIGAGFCIIVGYAWLSLLAFLAFWITYSDKMAEEEETLMAECGPAYRAYHAAVPRLLPTFARYPDRQGRWSWRGVAASKEWKTVIWTIVLLIGFYFWEEAVQEQKPLFGEHRLLQGALLGIAVALALVDGLIELLNRRRQPA